MIEHVEDVLHAGHPILVLLAGLAVGALHAFEPDHIAAVSGQMARRRGTPGPARRGLRRITLGASAAGALWGAGHTAGICAMGLLMAIFSVRLPDGLFAGMEVAVGLMLITLGALAVSGRRTRHVHTHPHRHADGTVHTHGHAHDGEHRHGHGPYVIGCIHGLAGSGALVALFASGLDSTALFYFLAVFGAGSILGMMLASGVIGIPLGVSSTRSAGLFRRAAAIAAVAIGMVVIYRAVSGPGLPL